MWLAVGLGFKSHILHSKIHSQEVEVKCHTPKDVDNVIGIYHTSKVDSFENVNHYTQNLIWCH